MKFGDYLADGRVKIKSMVDWDSPSSNRETQINFEFIVHHYLSDHIVAFCGFKGFTNDANKKSPTSDIGSGA